MIHDGMWESARHLVNKIEDKIDGTRQDMRGKRAQFTLDLKLHKTSLKTPYSCVKNDCREYTREYNLRNIMLKC